MRHNPIAALLLLFTLSACGGGGDYVAQANRAPVAAAGPAQTVAAGTSVKLAGSGTDADRDILSYTWTLTRPTGSAATLLNSKVATPTFFADLPGVYTATLVVDDGKLSSAPSSVAVTAQ